MMKHLQSNTDQASVYIYNADDERIVTFSCFSAAGSSCVSSPASETWTLRGLGNEVLRVFSHPRGESFEWERDYVYRRGLLLASVDSDASGFEETFSFHLDHLGSPRQVTKGGSQVALHSYYPFGQEATSSSSDEFQLKFTGHERDKNGAGAKSELDYMHARHCSPVLGRFLSIDPAVGRKTRSQSWNRYTYGLDGPVRFVDPNGLEPLDATILQFYNTALGDDFGNVDLRLDSKRVPKNFGGITIGRNLHLARTESNDYRNRALDGIVLVGHELVPVGQYRKHGKIGFLKRYLREYRRNRKQGQTKNEAYRNISFEERAAEFGENVRAFLKANPEILGKLQEGEELNEADITAVNRALREALDESGIQEGYQFIGGRVFYVRIQ